MLFSRLKETERVKKDISEEIKDFENVKDDGMIGYRIQDLKPKVEIEQKERNWNGLGKGIPQRSDKRDIDLYRPYTRQNYKCERYIESISNAVSIAGNPTLSSFNTSSFNISKSEPDVFLLIYSKYLYIYCFL